MQNNSNSISNCENNNLFVSRHIGSNESEIQSILSFLNFDTLDDFINDVIPKNLISKTVTTGQKELQEHVALSKLKKFASSNINYKNYIGIGYYDTITPNVIKRNVLENPSWYTAYTPYQAEISQGRLEALLNFQQMIMDLTGFNLANASLLDEATAASEAMSMALRINDQVTSNSKPCYFVDCNTFPQTIDVIKTRAKYQNIDVVVGDIHQIDLAKNISEYIGIQIQNPNLYGTLYDYSDLIQKIKQTNPKCIISMACDILSLVLFKSPQQMGADIAIGSTQRFGIPLGFGGPSAGYFATDNKYKRIIPGRIIGVSVDARSKKSLRMSLQTREQHIRREKATSNICTSQVLLANMASFYAVYHGANGLKNIANNIHQLTEYLYQYLEQNIKEFAIEDLFLFNVGLRFDTVAIKSSQLEYTYSQLLANGYAVGFYNNILLISIGETSNIEEIIKIANIILSSNINNKVRIDFNTMICNKQQNLNNFKLSANNNNNINNNFDVNINIQAKYKNIFRKDSILAHPVFNSYHSETQIMRYIKKLEMKDISLVHSMIPLGSCTMKLNSASQLEGLSWPEFANIHPFAPKNSTLGYIQLIEELKQQLKSITGFDDISMQPNSGAQGELTGLLAIRRYQESLGQNYRNICLIPRSAHGTNPATAQMLGLEVIIVGCDSEGNVDINDLNHKAKLHSQNLSCLMITYPSTHGVFEAHICQICDIIHQYGAQVYMDGANLNALVGIVKPAELGVDVSHINLHKTFAIPHGGGGPGMGPIGVKSHLIPFLPKHIVYDNLDLSKINTNYIINNGYNAVSSSPFGSASILIISWMYITMLGEKGLKKATKIAILNANYLAKSLNPYFPVLFTGQNNLVAHECIIDLRPIKTETGVTEVDIAKRLMDYGFHSPTMSFPVVGTLMIEPTESEDKNELDRFINAMIGIYNEIKKVKDKFYDKINNPLKNAPHTLADIINWDKPYSIEVGCFPAPYLKDSKVFPSVNRIDDAHGDRNFVCNCFDFDN